MAGNFSSYDVADSLTEPEQSYINLCGSRLGVAALFQTEAATAVNFNPLRNFEEVLKELDGIDFESKTSRHQASILNDLGLGYYTWTPKRNRIYPGDLNNGLNLTRIPPRRF